MNDLLSRIDKMEEEDGATLQLELENRLKILGEGQIVSQWMEPESCQTSGINVGEKDSQRLESETGKGTRKIGGMDVAATAVQGLEGGKKIRHVLCNARKKLGIFPVNLFYVARHGGGDIVVIE